MIVKNKIIVFIIVIIVSILIGVVFNNIYIDNLRRQDNLQEALNSIAVLRNVDKQEQTKKFEPETILFVGDMMFDRGVEYLMNKNSFYYPFEKICDFLKKFDFVIGNLEGAIVENPPKFHRRSFSFAFSPDILEPITFCNFNLFSLANNHSLNMGNNGFEEMKKILKNADIGFVGCPVKCDYEDVILEKNDIIFLGFNKTFDYAFSDDEIIEFVKQARKFHPEKFMIVMCHWGQEYKLKSSVAQQNLARKIIDNGCDLIIGHHPHVVQEIEIYNKKLIFYSLGNFIFDQYFSEAVEQSLGIGLEIYPDKIVYKLFPIQSNQSQPFLMEQEQADKFLEKLSARSSATLEQQIKNYLIEVEIKKENF